MCQMGAIYLLGDGQSLEEMVRPGVTYSDGIHCAKKDSVEPAIVWGVEWAWPAQKTEP